MPFRFLARVNNQPFEVTRLSFSSFTQKKSTDDVIRYIMAHHAYFKTSSHL